MTSAIVLSDLALDPGVGTNKATWLESDPAGGVGPLYLQLAAVELWAGTVNDRTAAVKVAEGADFAFHLGMVQGQTYYYWIRGRTRTPAPDYTDWFPFSSTAGLAGADLIGTLIVPAISTLTSQNGLNQISLQWAFSDPNTNKLGHLALDSVEVWAATSNNRAAAALIGNERHRFVDTGLQPATTRFYWVRPVHKSGVVGSFFPASSTGGISGTTTTSLDVRGTTGTFTTLSATSGGYTTITTTTFSGSATGGQVVDLSQTGDIFGAMTSTQTGLAQGGIKSTKNTGGFCFYAAAGTGAAGYGPFTGAHDALIAADAEIDDGDIVCDVRTMFRAGLSDTISEVARSARPRERCALGVLVGRHKLGKGASEVAAFRGLPAGTIKVLRREYYLASINALGEGQINVCGENGPIAAGDLLVTSSVPGKAMRQDDDIVRSCTVARAREGAGLHDASDRARIACIYMSG